MIIREAREKDKKFIKAIHAQIKRSPTIGVHDCFFRKKRFKDTIYLLAEDEKKGKVLGTAAFGSLKVQLENQVYQGVAKQSRQY